MNESQQEFFEKQLFSIVKELDYPPSPDIAGSVTRNLRGFSSPKGKRARGKGHPRFLSRRLAWSLTVLLILCSSLLLIPPARAAILEFIQIGAVRIFRGEPAPWTPPDQELPAFPVTATPGPAAQPLIPMLEHVAGEMTLAEARKTVGYPILLPSYPSDLGQPDRIFVQEADGKMVILVWADPQQPDRVLMSLHLIPPGSWAINKMRPQIVQETTVNGQRAIWAIGPYPLLLSNGDMNFIRMVDGHVLIWTEGDLTYRLETDLSVEEAVKVAESLQSIR